MDIDKFLERMKKDRNFRGIILFVLSLVVFAGVLSHQMLKYFRDRPIEGSVQLVACDKCPTQEVRNIVDISDPSCKCSKCGERVGITWKCGKCQFEFPYHEPEIPIKSENNNRAERMDWLTANRKCPNCGSNKISPKAFKDPNPNAF